MGRPCEICDGAICCAAARAQQSSFCACDWPCVIPPHVHCSRPHALHKRVRPPKFCCCTHTSLFFAGTLTPTSAIASCTLAARNLEKAFCSARSARLQPLSLFNNCPQISILLPCPSLIHWLRCCFTALHAHAIYTANAHRSGERLSCSVLLLFVRTFHSLPMMKF